MYRPAVRLRGVVGSKKKQFQSLADTIGAYGAVQPVEGYEAFVGLWLNRGRVGTWHANNTLRGIEAAVSGRMNERWFLDLAETEDEGKAAFGFYQANLAQRETHARTHHRSAT